MHDSDISPDDPRLTAYALGELSGDERATVEAALRRSSELRAVMEDIRSTTAQIEAALAAEAAEAELIDPPLPFPIPGVVARKAEKTGAAQSRRLRLARRGKVIAFPRPAIWLSGFAAACIAMAIVQRVQTTPPAIAIPTVAMATPAPAVSEPVSATPIVVALPPPLLALDPVPEPALAAEPMADTVPAIEAEVLPAVSGLALLEQTASEFAETSAQSAPVYYFAPLAPPTGPIVTSLGASVLPVGLPTTAREPQFLLNSFSEEPATRSQAMLRLQNEDERIAQLRGTGSLAETARLLSNAQRGEGPGAKAEPTTAKERGEKR